MILIIIIVELLAIAANLGLPLMQDVSLRGRAVSVAREMEQVRDATLRARGPGSDWSAPPEPGAPPVEVKALLPGFAFTHEDCRLVWNRWAIDDPAPLGLQTKDLAAVTVIASDPRLAALVARELPNGRTRLTLGDRTTLVIEPAASGR
jgi:hypothetical protein